MTTTTESSSSTSRNNVSGRNWKATATHRSSQMMQSTKRKNQSCWKIKEQRKREFMEMKRLQKQLAQEKKQAILEKKERRLEQLKRQQQNEFERLSKQSQTLNHSKLSSTLKTMSKKQLRQIKKSRINPQTGVAEFVSAYAK